jgi:hypothetical protein
MTARRERFHSGYLTVERHGSEDGQGGRHGGEIGLWLHLVVVVLLLLLSVC